jgi:hypothetical protein
MMWYDRMMILSKERPRFWPFVIVALLGLILLGGVVLAVVEHSDPPAVELLK